MEEPPFEIWFERFNIAKSWLKKNAIRLLNNMVLIERIVRFCFIFGLVGVAGIGVMYAIPTLYTGYDEWVTWTLQTFGTFIALQLVVNWLCIRYVDCSYNPFEHGAIPDGVRMGENVCEIRERDENQNGGQHGRSRKDAMCINMNESVVYVATEMPKAENLPPKRTVYPYFSWTPCLRCNRPRPPRCHHCPLCNKCILKRDHHCFMTGVCVGYYNLRHFAVFVFWAVVGTTFGVINGFPYMHYEVFIHTGYIDFIFPIAILRAIFGYTPWKSVLQIILGWFCMAYLLWSVSFLKKIKIMIQEGKTIFEQEFKMNVRDNRTLLPKLRSVFGYYWMLNFIIPLHFVFKPIDDPVIWPYIKEA